MVEVAEGRIQYVLREDKCEIYLEGVYIGNIPLYRGTGRSQPVDLKSNPLGLVAVYENNLLTLYRTSNRGNLERISEIRTVPSAQPSSQFRQCVGVPP
jgi:hypothetical protein